MLWEAVARHVDSADDGGNLLLDDPGQSPLFLHGVRKEVNLVLKKLSIVAQSLEIVGQEARTASDFFVDLPDFWAGLFVRQNWKKRHQWTPPARSGGFRDREMPPQQCQQPTPLSKCTNDRRSRQSSATKSSRDCLIRAV